MIEDEYGTSITDENTLDYLLHMEFTLIEENPDINIQDIREQNIISGFYKNPTQNEEDLFSNVKSNQYKINELIQAIKQLDRQINNN